MSATPTPSTAELDDLVGPIPDWRIHAREAVRALTRRLRARLRRLRDLCIPRRELVVYLNDRPGRIAVRPYLVDSTWTWAGRVISHRRSESR